MKKTSVFENGLIWFGAAVSLAEILTGTYHYRRYFAGYDNYRINLYGSKQNSY